MTIALAGYLAANRPQIEQKAREDLIAMCAADGDIQIAFIDFCAEHGPRTHAAFVTLLERANAHLWTRQVARVFSEQFADEF